MNREGQSEKLRRKGKNEISSSTRHVIHIQKYVV